jgi:hypothetical protein
MKKTLITLSLLSLVFSSTGCLGRIIKEGWEGLEQGKGRFDIQSVDPGSLADYSQFEIGTFSDDTNGTAPTQFFADLPEAFRLIAAAEGLPQHPGGKKLVIDGVVIYYESAAITGQVFGPFEEVVARVEYKDGSTGKVIARGTAVGRTGATTAQGPRTKAGGLSKGLIKFIIDHYPESQLVDD